mmetsp:Transcript_38151/g.86522  ORF Transcript_38151/g.86522 Transcript_38151/m.86522 type:complete len:88 (-) Transcript_38151:246-509(-)
MARNPDSTAEHVATEDVTRLPSAYDACQWVHENMNGPLLADVCLCAVDCFGRRSTWASGEVGAAYTKTALAPNEPSIIVESEPEQIP